MLARGVLLVIGKSKCKGRNMLNMSRNSSEFLIVTGAEGEWGKSNESRSERKKGLKKAGLTVSY